MADNQVRKKRVKVAFGNRPKPWRLKIFLFIAIAVGILFVFYMFSLVELKPASSTTPSDEK